MSLPALPVHLSKDWIQNSYRNFGMHLNNSFQGPTLDSNWLIKDYLLVGGYPDSVSKFNSIKSANINKFVCLNAEYGTITERHYFMNYDSLLSPGDFMHFPMKDMREHESDTEVYETCVIIANMIKDGHKVYIHCTGGHGRTGIISMIVLYMLYKKPIQELYNYMQYAHDQRIGHAFNFKISAKHITDMDLRRQFMYGQVPTPQLTTQRNQVERIISQLETKILARKTELYVLYGCVANNCYAEDVAVIGTCQ